jgi:type IV secretion system protein VirB6
MISFIDIYRTTSSKLSKMTLLFLCIFLLSSCNQDLPPIEADDFGYPKVTLYAKGKKITGEEENQLSEWVSTGYKYNGDQIVIMAYNPASTSGGLPLKYTWNPWLCKGENSICVSMQDSPRCELSTSDWCINPRDQYESIANAPCYLAQGEGAYLLITDPANQDPTSPNTYENINRLPSDAGYYTKSLWDKSTDSSMYNNGEEAQGYSGELIPNPTITYTETGEKISTPSTRSAESYIDGEAYFKILDRYYDDNSGYQYLVMKRGFDSVVPPPIASVIDFITDTMDDTSQELYERLVTDSEYRKTLKVLLVLYIIVHGLLYIGGVSDMTQSELMSLFIKLIIVIQLLTGVESGQLFYNYFFQFFTSGLDEIISITTSNIDGTNNGFDFFDRLLGLLFSYETSMKIQALIWSFPAGFVVTFIIYAGFALFSIAIAKAAMIYLLAYMAISLLIVVAPVFICFLLFQTTRPLFEQWLGQFSNYFMQTVLVFAALNLLGQIIVDQIYMTLGFKACYEDNLKIGSWVLSKAWFICSDLTTGLVATEVPGYGYNTTIPCDPPTSYECPDTSLYCEPFDPDCVDDRYPDLPFLDPDIERENDLIQVHILVLAHQCFMNLLFYY